MVVGASLSGLACAVRAQPSAVSPAVPPSSTDRRASATVETTDAALARALAVSRGDPSADNLAAIAAEYSRLGVADLAVDFLTRALSREPRNPALYAARARAWRDWGRPDLALGDAHRAVSMSPESADAYNTRGTVQFVLGLADDAAASFRRALELAPSAPWALNNLCYVAFTTGDDAEAVRRCRAALDQDPSSMTARNNLALVHATAGRLSEARAVLMASGDRAAAFFNFGIVLMARRDYAAAADAFAEACQPGAASAVACRRAIEARALASGRARKPQP